jgi:uncharacterized protein YecT (DUF1311 family)
MKTRAFFALLLSLPLTAMAAEKNPFPEGWTPGLESLQADLEDQLQSANAQQEMNRVSGQIVELKDARLALVYLRLYSALPERERGKLKAEQKTWLAFREKNVAEQTPPPDERGSITPLEENEAFIKATDVRIKVLENRLAALK